MQKNSPILQDPSQYHAVHELQVLNSNNIHQQATSRALSGARANFQIFIEKQDVDKLEQLAYSSCPPAYGISKPEPFRALVQSS